MTREVSASVVQSPLHCNCGVNALPPLLPGARVDENKVCLLEEDPSPISMGEFRR